MWESWHCSSCFNFILMSLSFENVFWSWLNLHYTCVCDEGAIGSSRSYIKLYWHCADENYFFSSVDDRSCKPGNLSAIHKTHETNLLTIPLCSTTYFPTRTFCLMWFSDGGIKYGKGGFCWERVRAHITVRHLTYVVWLFQVFWIGFPR